MQPAARVHDIDIQTENSCNCCDSNICCPQDKCIWSCFSSCFAGFFSKKTPKPLVNRVVIEEIVDVCDESKRQES